MASLLANGVRASEIYRVIDQDLEHPLNFRRGAVYASNSFRFAAGRFGRLLWAVGKNAMTGMRQSVPDMLAAAERDLPAGFFSLTALEVYLRETFAAFGLKNSLWRSIASCFIPAIDLDRAQRVVFGRDDLRDVPISEAVAASSAIPGFFEPYTLRGRDYVDGGVGFSGHADLAAEAGADVVIVVNPLVPNPDGGVVPLRNRGLYTIMEQAGRIYSQNLLQLGLSTLRIKHPRTEFHLIQPDARRRRSSARRWASRRAAPRSATATSRRASGSTGRASGSCAGCSPCLSPRSDRRASATPAREPRRLRDRAQPAHGDARPAPARSPAWRTPSASPPARRAGGISQMETMVSAKPTQVCVVSAVPT